MKQTDKKLKGRSFGGTMKAIAWSFIGLRSKRDFDDDVAGGMNPFYVIIAGLIGAALFIALLVFFARSAAA